MTDKLNIQDLTLEELLEHMSSNKSQASAEILRRDARSKTPQCERCGVTGTAAVSWDMDPFMLEIHDKEVWKWLCRACHHEYCMEI